MGRNEATGQVITFYSYKGGVGRSMALANVACLLAQRCSAPERVLMIDWDLEAPGLHVFFQDRCSAAMAGNQDPKTFLDAMTGLIELLTELDRAVRQGQPANAKQSLEQAEVLLKNVDIERFVIETDIPCLSLIKAGRFDDEYASRVNSFDWAGLYERSPWLFRAFVAKLSARYRYVLIDSRTGVTDTSGICTMLMPEKLVVVFTPNRQSLFGAERRAREALEYRKQSDDLRPLVVFPLASRVEPSEPELKGKWRRDPEFGYQPLFERLFSSAYELSECNLQLYFEDVLVQHLSRYAYGEEIAVLDELQIDRLSLTRSFEHFVNWLVEQPSPWNPAIVSAFDVIAPEQVSRFANLTFARLSVEKQGIAKRVLSRLVRVAGAYEIGGNTAQQIELEELDVDAAGVIKELADARIVSLERDDKTGNTYVHLAHESIIKNWRQLNDWIEQDREFLLWTQKLRGYFIDWDRNGRHASELLSGPALLTAKQWLDERVNDISAKEISYIRASIKKQDARRQLATSITFVVILSIAAAGLWKEMTGSIEINGNSDQVSFGEVSVNDVSKRLVQVKNNSYSFPFKVNPIGLGDLSGDSSDFKVVDQCSNEIQSNIGCTIDVEFVPQAAGARRASLTVTGYFLGFVPQKKTVQLTGIGVNAPVVRVSPKTLDFGMQAVGTPGKPEKVIVENAGSLPLKITTIGRGGTNAEDFFVYTDHCTDTTVMPSKSCSIDIQFVPLQVGGRKAKLAIISNASGSPHALDLNGNAVGSLFNKSTASPIPLRR